MSSNDEKSQTQIRAERQAAADAANKAAAEAFEKASSPQAGNLGVGGFGAGTPKHHTIELTENLGISGGVSGSVQRKPQPPSSAPAQDTISSGKTRAQVQVAQKEIRSQQVSISAQRAATEQKLKDIDAAIAARPPPKQEKYGSARVVGGKVQQKYRTIPDKEMERLQQQRYLLQRDLQSLTAQEQELQSQSGQLFVMEREATKQQATAASLEQVETRQKYISKAAEARARHEVQKQQTEAQSLASAYNWRKPSAYHVQPDWLVPGAIEESSRQNVLSVVASDQPEAARQSRSLYATYKDVAPKTFFEESELGGKTTTHTTLSLVESAPQRTLTKEEARLYNTQQVQALRGWIVEQKKAGIKEVTITVNGVTKTVPIGQAATSYFAALKQDPNAVIKAPTILSLTEDLSLDSGKMGVKGITQDVEGKVNTLVGRYEEKGPEFRFGQAFTPLSLQDNVLTGIGSIEGKPYVVSLDFGKTEPQEKGGSSVTSDFTEAQSTFFKRAELALDKDFQTLTDKKFIPRATAALLATGASISSLLGLAGAAITPKDEADRLSQIPRKDVYVPQSFLGASFGSLSELSPKQLQEYYSKYGISGLSGELYGEGLLLTTKLPFGVAKYAQTALEGTKAAQYLVTVTRTPGLTPITRTFKTAQEAFEYKAQLALTKPKGYVSASTSIIENPIKSLTVFDQPVLSKVGSSWTIGSPLRKSEKFPEIFRRMAPAEGGVETATLTDYARNIVLSPEGKKALVEAGVALPRDIAARDIEIQALKLIAEAGVKPKIQNELTPTLAVKGEAEAQALLESVLPTLQPVKGNFAQIQQVRELILRGSGRSMTSDIDADYHKFLFSRALKAVRLEKFAEDYEYKRALKDVTFALEQFKKVERPERFFWVSGTKLLSGDIKFPLKAESTLKTETKSVQPTEQGLVFYHGTPTKEAKASILKEGFDFPEERGVFLAPKKGGYFGAKEWGKNIVQVTIKPTAKVLKITDDFEIDPASIIKGKEPPRKLLEGNIPQGLLREEGEMWAKRAGYEGIDRPIDPFSGAEGEREIVIFSEKAIEKISEVAAKTKRATGTKITGKAGESLELLAKIKSRQIKPEIAKEEKVIETLTAKDQVITGSPVSDLTMVHGEKYTGDITKGVTKGGKKYKLMSLEDQLKTKLASTSRIQGPQATKWEGEGAPDFLKAGAEIQKTERGYGMLSEIYRLKDQVDVPLIIKEYGLRFQEEAYEQSAKNIKKMAESDLYKQGVKLVKDADEYKKLYPEIDFGAEQTRRIYDRDIPSKFSSYKVGAKVRSALTPAAILGGKAAVPSAESDLSRTTKSPQVSSSVIAGSRGSSAIIKYSPSNISSKYVEYSVTPSKSSAESRASERVSRLTGSKSTSPRPSKMPVSKSPYGSAGFSGFSPASASVGSPSPRPSTSARPSVVSKITGSPRPSARASATVSSRVLYERFTKPAKPVGVWVPRARISQDKPTPRKSREDFFGSTHEATILGMRDIVKKGRDFDYGDIKTAKLVEKDIALTSKGRAKFLISKKPDLISRSKKGLRVEPKKINWGKRASWI